MEKACIKQGEVMVLAVSFSRENFVFYGETCMGIIVIKKHEMNDNSLY